MNEALFGRFRQKDVDILAAWALFCRSTEIRRSPRPPSGKGRRSSAFTRRTLLRPACSTALAAAVCSVSPSGPFIARKISQRRTKAVQYSLG